MRSEHAFALGLLLASASCACTSVDRSVDDSKRAVASPKVGRVTASMSAFPEFAALGRGVRLALRGG